MNDSVNISAHVRRFREDDKRQMREDAQRVLATPEGRRLLMAIVGIGGVYAPVGRCNGSANDMAYETGRRDAASDLLIFCNSCARDQVQLAASERTALSTKREMDIDPNQTTRKEHA